MGKNRNIYLLPLLFSLCAWAFTYVHGSIPPYTSWAFAVSDLKYAGSVAFVVTPQYGLWRSTDEGMTWTLQNIGGVAKIVQDNVNPNHLLFIGHTSGFASSTPAWSTTDALQTYQNVTIPVNVKYVDPHPTQSGYILVNNGECFGVCQVYATNNLGASWSAIGSQLSVKQANWGLANDSTIYIATNDLTCIYTSDWVTLHTIYSSCLGIAITSNFYFMGLMVNKEMVLVTAVGDPKQASSYQTAQFPFGEDVSAIEFHFLDDSTGAQWLGVYSSPTSTWGKIYTSGAQGLKYTMSLPYVHMDSLFDFSKVNAIEGIYFSNVVLNYDQAGETAVEATMATFDNGGEWQYLTPPDKHFDGTPIFCSGDCHLQLNGPSNSRNFFSESNAPGLLMATGNLGRSLSDVSTDMYTYMSRDAGLTWMEVASGINVYDIGDHGGVIMWADSTTATNTIYWSLDEGLNTTAYQLRPEDELLSIKQIKNNPSGMGRKFLVIAETKNGSPRLLGFDFSEIWPTLCTQSDYEGWSPSDGRPGEQCLLGRTVTYNRRKRSSACLNNPAYEGRSSPQNCNCTREDYECDFGFEETELGCVMSNVNPPQDPPSSCPSGTTYQVSKGYRKVAGDSCVNEIPEYTPITKNCPAGEDSSSSSNGTVVAVVVIIILAVVAIAAFLVYRNEEWREKVLAVIGQVIPIGDRPSSSRYTRLGRPGSLADEEFGIGGEHDLDDEDVEEDAPVLQDNDILQATADRDKRSSET